MRKPTAQHNSKYKATHLSFLEISGSFVSTASSEQRRDDALAGLAIAIRVAAMHE